MDQPFIAFSVQFQSTCPARGTTGSGGGRPGGFLFQSTCPARGTTSAAPVFAKSSRFQSTCPARGTTGINGRSQRLKHDFNPRAPRGARQHQWWGLCPASSYFNPRAPRGARHWDWDDVSGYVTISIHVPREGHDSKHAQFLRANLRKSYNYPFERDALHAKNACKLINASS